MDFGCCLLTQDLCWRKILYSVDLAAIARGAGAGAMHPTAAAALAGGKAFLVSLYPHEKGDFSHFMADQGPMLDEETNQNSIRYPVIP